MRQLTSSAVMVMGTVMVVRKATFVYAELENNVQRLSFSEYRTQPLQKNEGADDVAVITFVDLSFVSQR